jgi:hypothetical protein
MQIAQSLPQTSAAHNQNQPQTIQLQMANVPQTSSMQVHFQETKPIISTLNQAAPNVIFAHPNPGSQGSGTTQTVQRIITTHNGQPTEILQIVQPLTTIQQSPQSQPQQIHHIHASQPQAHLQPVQIQPQQSQAKPVQQRITLGKA